MPKSFPSAGTCGKLFVVIVGASVWIKTASTDAAQNYIGVDLYTLTYPSTFVEGSDSQQASGGQVVGYTFQSPSNALLWNGPSGINLNPTNLSGYTSSFAYATNGTQQVGKSSGPATGSQDHAMLWNGSANSAVDLNPTNLGFNTSSAAGTNGTQQVGSAGIVSGPLHAVLWNGTANSAVDLTPTGFQSAGAAFTTGSQQVGSGFGSATGGFDIHALLWNGTASSIVDLNPAGSNYSGALGTDGIHQVGVANVAATGDQYAVLWSGTAASAVNLNPTNLSGFISSTAYSVSGSIQVGYGFFEGPGPSGHHALLWSGTSDSTVDLNSLLPSSSFGRGGATDSVAYSIDASGDIFGIAYDSANRPHAVEWEPVPEPSTLALLAIGFSAVGLFVRRRLILR